jgi:hypothetical protein
MLTAACLPAWFGECRKLKACLDTSSSDLQAVRALEQVTAQKAHALEAELTTVKRQHAV